MLSCNSLTPQHINTSTHRLALFASGSGSNAEAIITYFQDHPSISVVTLLSNNPGAYALERAKKFKIPTMVFNRQQLRETHEVLAGLREKQVTHIVLAGFLWLLPQKLVEAYANRVINIHPALLPKHGGKGMYGIKVHEAVKSSGEKETGITIHLVNEKYDDGKILLQARVPLDGSETPDQIAQKVHELEYRHYPAVIEKWVKNS